MTSMSLADPPVTRQADIDEAVAAYERKLIVNALVESRGIQTQAARSLGTTRRILGYKIQKLNIRPDEIRVQAPRS